MSQKNQFSKEALKKLTPCEKCKYYVYRLVDPHNNNTFYVGKGCGNRIFQHSVACDKLISKNEDELSLKFAHIRHIHNSGKEVICLIHRWGLTEEEALEVESALIDCYPGLSNIQGGFGTDRGVISVEDMEKLCQSNVYAEPLVDYIIIKTSEDAVKQGGSLYEATRQAWRGKLERAKKYNYVLSVIYGQVKEVYEVDRWYAVGNRIAFEGKATTNTNLLSLKGKLLPPKYMVKGMANPFLYKKK